MKKLVLSWESISDAVDALAFMVAPSKPSLIVGVSRGGLIPATLLSHRLDVSMAVVVASSYEGTRRTLNKPTIIEGWRNEYDSSNVLVIDDVLDSGETYAALRAKSIRGEFKFACLVNKQPARFTQALYYAQVPLGTWVEFPWEKQNVD